ncbi:MAG: hypothetical protein ACNA7H_08955, partial [Desulfotignum sp.]
IWADSFANKDFLFHLYLAAALLQVPEPVFRKTRPLLMDRLDFDSLTGFTPPPETPGLWCSMPVVLTHAGRTHIRYFALGKTSSPVPGMMPPWAVPLFDPAAFEAVLTAARAALTLCDPAGPDRLFCFPLTFPDPLADGNRSVQFQGRSLGLPLALGFAALLNRHPVPEALAATGEITEQGTILPVSHLDLKKTGLEEHKKFNALIYPSAGAGLPASGPLTCLPVSTLGQAFTLFSLYSPDSKENLMLLAASLEDPRVLVKNIGDLPCTWLQWITRHRFTEPVREALVADPHLFAACTDAFEHRAGVFDIDHARAVQALVPEQAVDRHCRTGALSAFRWCTAALSLANHCGDTEDARFWEEKGLGLADTISRADLFLVTDFYNHALVARHNRYRFSPELPPALTGLLDVLESQYQPKCTFGCPTEPALGRLYGTLMQHFAFCGPGCLDLTRTFFYKAIQALGKDQVKEYRQEWLRQYNYLTYALLDAGDLAGACQSLLSYFDCPGMGTLTAHLCDPETRLTPWQTALAARFFARDRARADREPIFRQLLQRFQADPGHAHPRQLTAFNLGRLALGLQETAAGSRLLRRSVDLCFSPDAGPTIQVMALLPISFLPDAALPARPVRKAWEHTIRSAASHLDAAHFSPILEIPLDAARSRIRQTPAAWFPFTYR